jgi:mRNA-degrading endonuclease RelE of RelBE toxin-antitoxin system
LAIRLEFISRQPLLFGVEESNRSARKVHRCPLLRFPYRIIYEVRENELVVLAVAHDRRRPGYWRRRV